MIVMIMVMIVMIMVMIVLIMAMIVMIMVMNVMVMAMIVMIMVMNVMIRVMNVMIMVMIFVQSKFGGLLKTRLLLPIFLPKNLDKFGQIANCMFFDGFWVFLSQMYDACLQVGLAFRGEDGNSGWEELEKTPYR